MDKWVQFPPNSHNTLQTFEILSANNKFRFAELTDLTISTRGGKQAGRQEDCGLRKDLLYIRWRLLILLLFLSYK